MNGCRALTQTDTFIHVEYTVDDANRAISVRSFCSFRSEEAIADMIDDARPFFLRQPSLFTIVNSLRTGESVRTE